MKNPSSISILLILLSFFSACNPKPDAEDCNILSMKKFKGIPVAYKRFQEICEDVEIKYTPEVCQSALVHLMKDNSLQKTKEEFGEPIEHCFTGDDLRRFSKD